MIWGIVGLVIILALFILLYNQIIREQNQVNNSFATVDVFLKKRYDLIPNIIEVVKGHVEHEKEVFENVAGIRARALNSTVADETVKIDGELNTALKSLFAVAEQYPNLKTNESFLQLQKNLLNIEDELAAARRTYNAAATEYNITVESFPTNLIAAMISKKKKELFSVTDEVKNVIHIDM